MNIRMARKSIVTEDEMRTIPNHVTYNEQDLSSNGNIILFAIELFAKIGFEQTRALPGGNLSDPEPYPLQPVSRFPDRPQMLLPVYRFFP